MGSPYFYAIEMPIRAHQLVTDFWPCVEGQDYKEYGGPLATTFLVAMAGPMINFPYERLYRPNDNKDEREIHLKTTDDFDRMIDTPSFGGTPFFLGGAWRYTYVEDPDLSVLAIPAHVLSELAAPEAQPAAAKVNTETWFNCLRHCLAHSTIAYLDKDGQQIPKAPTEMIAFVSEHRVGKKHVGNHVFRITRADFRAFLDVWVEWLQS